MSYHRSGSGGCAARKRTELKDEDEGDGRRSVFKVSESRRRYLIRKGGGKLIYG